MKTVELKTAYHWNCDYCGLDNFVLPQKAEMTDEDAEQCYRTFHHLDQWEELPEGWRQFEMVTIPDFVICQECGARFETESEIEA